MKREDLRRRAARFLVRCLGGSAERWQSRARAFPGIVFGGMWIAVAIYLLVQGEIVLDSNGTRITFQDERVTYAMLVGFVFCVGLAFIYVSTRNRRQKTPWELVLDTRKSERNRDEH